MHRLIREPLLHFFLLGAVLFSLYGWLDRDGFDGPNEIVVSRGQVDSLQAQFERVWQREPSAQELQGLIESWVREEVFYREGLAMGLDRDDPVVRRRIQQKLEFIVDSAASAPPTTEELQHWLDDHADRYRAEAQYTLRQIYFDPARHGHRLETEIMVAQRAVAIGNIVPGDHTMLPSQLHACATDVVRIFGSDFEAALRELPLDSWQGPVRSGFGVHLVELTERETERAASLKEVRAAVERDVLHDRSQKAAAAVYERLRSNYTVRIEAAPAPSTPTG